MGRANFIDGTDSASIPGAISGSVEIPTIPCPGFEVDIDASIGSGRWWGSFS